MPQHINQNHWISFSLLGFLYLFIISFWAVNSYANNFEEFTAGKESAIEFKNNNKIYVLSIYGQISKKLYEKIKFNIDRLTNENIQPSEFIVLIDSMGGDAESALKIGRLLREKKAFIFVTNRCASACVYIYAGGVYRSSIPYSIGIHSAKITLNDKDSRPVLELNPERHEIARSKLEEFDKNSELFLAEMNINPKFHKKLKSLSSYKLNWLSNNEIQEFGLDGFDPFFLEKEYPNFKYIFERNISEAIFTEKINNSLKQCLYVKNIPQAFAKCYKSILMN
jgi:ATP-dependent protease ClpP protease subunit